MGILIDIEKCTGCGSCVTACPFGIIELTDDKARVKDGCTLCGACKEVCGFDAITIESTQPTKTAGDGNRGVWVFAEQRDGKLKNVGFELLYRGRELANALKTDLSAVCFGHGVAG